VQLLQLPAAPVEGLCRPDAAGIQLHRHMYSRTSPRACQLQACILMLVYLHCLVSGVSKGVNASSCVLCRAVKCRVAAWEQQVLLLVCMCILPDVRNCLYAAVAACGVTGVWQMPYDCC
jgi:hypothetical protein